MSKLERIITFIDVVEENSFAAAARKQKLSTAAISRKITALEDELGVQLLQRTTRQLRLTERGLHYYQQCKKTLQEFTEAENAIVGCKDQVCGELRITSSRYFGMHYLIPRLTEFMAENPNLRVDLELAERFPNLAKEGIDLLFGIAIEGPDELVRRKVVSTQFLLSASPKYLEKFGTPEIPADLSKHRYIAHTIRQAEINVIPFKDGKEIYVEPILSVNDSYALVKCALQDMGIVRTNCHVVIEEIEAGRLVEVLPDFKVPCQAVYLYYQQERYLQPKIRRFIDFYIPFT